MTYYQRLQLKFYRWILSKVKPSFVNQRLNSIICKQHLYTYTKSEVYKINEFIHISTEYFKKHKDVAHMFRFHYISYKFHNEDIKVTIYLDYPSVYSNSKQFIRVGDNHILNSYNNFITRHMLGVDSINYAYFNPFNPIKIKR